MHPDTITNALIIITIYDYANIFESLDGLEKGTLLPSNESFQYRSILFIPNVVVK